MSTIIKNVSGRPFIQVNGVTVPMTKITPDGFYHLPENPEGVKYIMVDLVKYHFTKGDEFVLTKESASARLNGVKNSVEKVKYPSHQVKKNITLEDIKGYLDPETVKVIEEAIEKYKEDTTRVLTDKEKIELKIQRLLEKKAKLEEEEG